MSDALIQTCDLWKTYHIGDIEVPAVRGVSLTVASGEFVSVMGPSGSGKSTFMHLIGCLDRGDRGTYQLDGTEVTTLPRRDLAELRNRKIGFVFQSFNLLARTTALENVALPLTYQAMRRRVRRTRAAEMLERVGLSDRMTHHPSQLSGGQQQRVAVARALITDPALLLADEPTGNLDTRTGIEIMALLQQLNRETGLTIILVTHETEIAAYTKRVVTFRDGVIASDVPNDEVREAVPPSTPAVPEAAPSGA